MNKHKNCKRHVGLEFDREYCFDCNSYDYCERIKKQYYDVSAKEISGVSLDRLFPNNEDNDYEY